MVAGLHGLDAFAHLLHDARALMSHHQRRPNPPASFHEAEVAVADAGGRQLHQYLALFRTLELNVVDDQRFFHFVQDGCLHFRTSYDGLFSQIKEEAAKAKDPARAQSGDGALCWGRRPAGRPSPGAKRGDGQSARSPDAGQRADCPAQERHEDDDLEHNQAQRGGDVRMVGRLRSPASQLQERPAQSRARDEIAEEPDQRQDGEQKRKSKGDAHDGDERQHGESRQADP